MSKQVDSMTRLLQAMANMRDRQRNELRELCKQPTAKAIAQAIMDSFERRLDYLCNYNAAIDGLGTKHDMLDVITELKAELRRDYLAITGADYSPTICRSIAHRNRKRAHP